MWGSTKMVVSFSLGYKVRPKPCLIPHNTGLDEPEYLSAVEDGGLARKEGREVEKGNRGVRPQSLIY
jgi:hypothetical protein